MRVLLADDQVWLRSALRLLLEHEAKIEVVGEAESIQSLASTVKWLHPDLLFLDWQLPGLDTQSARRKLIDTLRSIEPHLYIIALTNDDNTKRSKLAGADAYVNRAEPPEYIIAVLQQAMGKRTATTTDSLAGDCPSV